MEQTTSGQVLFGRGDLLPPLLDSPSTSGARLTGETTHTVPHNRERSRDRVWELGDARNSPSWARTPSHRFICGGDHRNHPPPSTHATSTAGEGLTASMIDCSHGRSWGCGCTPGDTRKYTSRAKATSERAIHQSWTPGDSRTSPSRERTAMDRRNVEIGPVAPYFHTTYCWRDSAVRAVSDLETTRNKLPAVSILDSSIVTGIIERHFPGLDSPASSQAGTNQIRATAYASVALALARLAGGMVTDHSNFNLCRAELLLEVATSILNEAYRARMDEPSLDFASATLAAANSTLEGALDVISLSRHRSTSPSLSTYRELSISSAWPTATATAPSAIGAARAKACDSPADVIRTDDWWALHCHNEGYPPHSLSALRNRALQAAVRIQSWYHSRGCVNLRRIPPLAERCDTWWINVGQDIAASLSRDIFDLWVNRFQTSVANLPLITATIENHFRGIDCRQFLVSPSSLRAKAYAATAHAVTHLMLGKLSVGPRCAVEYGLETANAILTESRTCNAFAPPHSTFASTLVSVASNLIDTASAKLAKAEASVSENHKQPSLAMLRATGHASAHLLQSWYRRLRHRRLFKRCALILSSHFNVDWTDHTLATLWRDGPEQCFRRLKIKLLCQDASKHAIRKIKETNAVLLIQAWLRRTKQRVLFKHCAQALCFQPNRTWQRMSNDAANAVFHDWYASDKVSTPAAMSWIQATMRNYFLGMDSKFNVRSRDQIQARAYACTAALLCQFAHIHALNNNCGPVYPWTAYRMAQTLLTAADRICQNNEIVEEYAGRYLDCAEFHFFDKADECFEAIEYQATSLQRWYRSTCLNHTSGTSRWKDHRHASLVRVDSSPSDTILTSVSLSTFTLSPSGAEKGILSPDPDPPVVAAPELFDAFNAAVTLLHSVAEDAVVALNGQDHMSTSHTASAAPTSIASDTESFGEGGAYTDILADLKAHANELDRLMADFAAIAKAIDEKVVSTQLGLEFDSNLEQTNNAMASSLDVVSEGCAAKVLQRWYRHNKTRPFLQRCVKLKHTPTSSNAPAFDEEHSMGLNGGTALLDQPTTASEVNSLELTTTQVLQGNGSIEPGRQVGYIPYGDNFNIDDTSKVMTSTSPGLSIKFGTNDRLDSVFSTHPFRVRGLPLPKRKRKRNRRQRNRHRAHAYRGEVFFAPHGAPSNCQALDKHATAIQRWYRYMCLRLASVQSQQDDHHTTASKLSASILQSETMHASASLLVDRTTILDHSYAGVVHAPLKGMKATADSTEVAWSHVESLNTNVSDGPTQPPPEFCVDYCLDGTLDLSTSTRPLRVQACLPIPKRKWNRRRRHRHHVQAHRGNVFHAPRGPPSLPPREPPTVISHMVPTWDPQLASVQPLQLSLPRHSSTRYHSRLRCFGQTPLLECHVSSVRPNIR